MPRTPKSTGPRKLPHRYPDEELWQVAGHDGVTNFVTGVIVSRGTVVSVPRQMAWMDRRDWLECVEECLSRGWQVRQLDPAEQEAIMQARARNDRGAVQTALDLGLPPTLVPPP